MTADEELPQGLAADPEMTEQILRYMAREMGCPADQADRITCTDGRTVSMPIWVLLDWLGTKHGHPWGDR